MTLAGIELRYLVNSLSEKSQDYYVSNVYGITRESLLIKLHHPEKSDLLLVISTFGLWLTSRRIEQVEDNKLVKRLRNDLIRLKLQKISQPGSERIAYLTFSGFGNEFVLVCEFFGEGNIILCNNEMKILALLHSIDVRHRKLSVGLTYSLPPMMGLDIFNLSKKQFNEITLSNIEIVKWVGRNLGLPKKYAEEICRRANIDLMTKGSELDEKGIDSIFESSTLLVKDVVGGNHSPYIDRSGKTPEAIPMKLDDSKEYESVSSFSEGLDQVFTEILLDKGKTIQTTSVNEQALQIKNQIEEQKKAIDLVKNRAKSITALANGLFSMISMRITRIDDPKAMEFFSNYSASLIKEKGIDHIVIEDQKIPVNLNNSIHSIASTLFDEAKRQTNAISAIEEQVKKSEKKLEKISNEKEKALDGVRYSEIRKKEWFERYRWFFTSDGLLAIGGRDSSSNSAIIRKHLEKNDRVFHAEIFGSPFFILKDNQDPPHSSIMEVAHATVCFSRAWREGMYGSSAYWVNPEQVKRAAPSGQFLPKGSFTIEGQRNFIKSSSLKLAVGLVEYDDELLVCCGPFEPIKKSSICYATIEPSGLEMVEAAKKIRNEFIALVDDKARRINLDEFVRVLPAGKSRIVEVGLGEIE